MDSGELPTQEAVGMKLGISQQAIAKFLKDGVMGTPTINKLIALYPEARAFIYNPSDEAQPLDNQLEDNLMAVPLINAHGGIPEFWDDETMSTLPKYITTKRTDGNYAGFVISGDSMDYDGKFAICEGDIVLGRELYKHHWRSKLHTPQLFIIVHSTRGCMVKEITAHDTEKGIITAHSFNEEYPDIKISLDEVVKLYYVKEIKSNRHYS